MNTQVEGHNLIFLISQPRAGSTMTQKILGNHPEIHTVSEPWIMLSPLYSLRFDDIETGYNAKLSKIGWQTFFQQLPNQYQTYYQGVRRMYSYIYDCALENTGKSYFLDKTPRYYYIIPELLKTFPKSCFLILLRNPLAVLCSIANTWIKNDWKKIHEFKGDLIKAPHLLVDGIHQLGDRCLVLQYEQLITSPEEEFKKICQFLGVEFYSEIIQYGSRDLTKWRFGDQNLVYQKDNPDSQNLDKWILSLKNPQIWQLANNYLEFLGYDLISQMGYSYIKLRDTLDANRPKELHSKNFFSVDWLPKNTQFQKTPQTSADYIKIARKEERKNRLTEAIAAYRKAINLNPNLAWAYNNLGKVLLKMKKLDDAVTNHRQAIELQPNSAWFHYSLAAALIEQNKRNEAAAHYQKAIILSPGKNIIQNKANTISEKQ